MKETQPGLFFLLPTMDPGGYSTAKKSSCIQFVVLSVSDWYLI